MWCLLLSLGLAGGCDSIGAKSDIEHVEEGKRHEFAQDYRAALISYKSALQQAPDNAEARLLLARAYLKTGQGQDALKELREAEKRGVAKIALIEDIGEALLLAGEYKRLLDEVRPEAFTDARKQARLVRLRADALYALMQFKDACEAYGRSIQLDPDLAQGHWGLASCEALSGNLDAAIARLQALVQRQPTNAINLVRLGEMLQRANRLAEAEQTYARALQADPELLLARLHRASIRLVQGRTKEAAADIDAAQRLDPKSPLTIYVLALRDYVVGDLAAARDKLARIYNRMQWHYQTVWLAASVTYALGEYANAETLLNRLLTIAPNDPRILRLLASSQLQQGLPQKALQTLQPLLRQKSLDTDTLALVGEAYVAAGEPGRGLEFLEQVQRARPNDRALQLSVAKTRLNAGAREQAITDLKRMVSQTPRWDEADRLYFQALLASGSQDQVLKEIASLPESKRQGNPEPDYYAAQAALAADDAVLARAHFQRSRSLKPDFVPALLGLAFLELKEKKPDVARRLFKEMLDRKPNDLDAMLGMAAVDLAVGQAKGAMQWWEEAARVHPRATLPRLRLAEQHLAEGRFDKATALAQELLTIAPDNIVYLRLLAQIHTASGNLASAQSVLTRLSALDSRNASVWLALANVQFGRRQYAAARQSIEHARRLQPEAQEPVMALIAIDVAEGKQSAALNRALDMQKRYPMDVAVQVLAGDVLYLTARYTEAAQAYAKAFRLSPNEAITLSWFKALYAAGNRDEARRVLADWIDRQPNSQGARLYLASLERDTGRPAAALPHYEHLLRFDPNNVLVLNELAIAYHMLKDQRALTTAERAYRLAPNPAVADTLAGILLDRGDARRALEVMEKIEADIKQNPEWRLTFARALLASGQTERARRELQGLARLPANVPQAVDAQRLLATLH